MGYKQPRVPEYRESDGTGRYLRTLSLFLKDFTLETWTNVQSLKKAMNISDDDGMYAFHIDEAGHLICTYDSKNPPPLSINAAGHLVYTIENGQEIDLGRVVGDGQGGTSFDTDATLTLKNGTLSVNTVKEVEKDNSLPVTSGAVYTVVGNINVLLETI